MLSPYQNRLITPRMNTHGFEEDDNIPLCQFLDKPPIQRMYFPAPLMTSFISRRPSYPTTPSSLLDPSSHDDEDDEDLVPIAVLQSPTSQRSQYQSAAEKYKEKVKAQLDHSEGPTLFRPNNNNNNNTVLLSSSTIPPSTTLPPLLFHPTPPIPPLLADEDDEDDDLPLSHCFMNKV